MNISIQPGSDALIKMKANLGESPLYSLFWSHVNTITGLGEGNIMVLQTVPWDLYPVYGPVLSTIFLLTTCDLTTAPSRDPCDLLGPSNSNDQQESDGRKTSSTSPSLDPSQLSLLSSPIKTCFLFHLELIPGFMMTGWRQFCAVNFFLQLVICWLGAETWVW